MQEWIRRDRANQHGMARRREPHSMGVTHTRYARLMQVNVDHTYYPNPNSGGNCSDFNVQPTPPTAAFMRSLGLLFFPEPTGFSVLYNASNAQGLFGYLREHHTNSVAGRRMQHWTRLSFVLSLNNLNFINFTDIPVNTDPTKKNFYFSNQNAQPDKSGAVLNGGKDVDASSLMRVDGPEVRVSTPDDVDRVVALDIAGQPVYFDVAGRQLPYVPRCIPQPASELGTAREVCRDVVYLDFATDNEDKYVIQTLDAAGNILRQWPMLYTISEPIPLCFIDLLFSQPTPDAEGVYPVRDLYPRRKTSVVTVNYVLKFDARSTFWRYYIVPQPQDKVLDNLAIETMGDGPQVLFDGPVETKLINGSKAYLFTSQQQLQLYQQSPYRFRLKGMPRHMPAYDEVLVARMPVASAAQILPEGGMKEPDDIYSDIYVYV